MIIHVPDPHPGRCLNHRRDPSDPYGVSTLRCLRTEGHAEACCFPEPPPLRLNPCNSYVQRQPEPWVEP